MAEKNFDIALDELAKKLPEFCRKDLPKKLGNRAVELFKDNFQNEGFFGSHWKEVKRRLGGAKGAAATRPILTDSGDLGNSIQCDIQDGKAEVFSDLPYAAAHNEGTTTAGRNHTTTIPKRQFIGSHKTLEDELEKEITDFLDQQIDSIL